MTRRERREETMRRHLERLERRIEVLDILDQRLFWSRWTVIAAGVLTAILLHCMIGPWSSALAMSVFLLACVVLGRCYRSVNCALIRHRAMHSIKAGHLARITLSWDLLPSSQIDQTRKSHAFSQDLNLTGPRSLHHLMDTSTSVGGSERLRVWLEMESKEPADVAWKQESVKELVRLTMFRDRLSLEGATIHKGGGRWNASVLEAWLDSNRSLPAIGHTLVILASLSLINIVLVCFHFLGTLPPFWIASFAAYLLYYGSLYFYSKVRDIHGLYLDATQLDEALAALKSVFSFLECYKSHRRPRIEELLERFRISKRNPSHYIGHLNALTVLLKLSNFDVLYTISNAILPWDLLLTYLLGVMKVRIGEELPAWLDTLYSVEALSSIASFSYLNPEAVFPELWDGDSGRGVVLETKCIAHPLLPASTRVANDFAIGHLDTGVLITGSNMSGKSTFLRTVGINLCLAYVGAPVIATAFKATYFRIFTCINTQDSVTHGISYFYSEVKRLKELLSKMDDRCAQPMFFLIDEIFRGTNNRERLIGSTAYLKAVMGKSHVGLVATHDLELADLVDTIPHIRNLHFCEEVNSRHLVFDYRLRPGPCPTTNALRIMAMEGLPID